MTSSWRSRWLVTVTGGVSPRDGIAWQFATLGHEDLWTVSREDESEFPAFSAARGDAALPPLLDLEAMTREAVADLLASADLADRDCWITKNISAALLLAAVEIVAWEGEEWAPESGDDDVALEWATRADGRTPFAWLRAKGAERDSLITVYQDDAVFGLSFVSTVDLQLPGSDRGSLRSRRDVPLVAGRIRESRVAPRRGWSLRC